MKYGRQVCSVPIFPWMIIKKSIFEEDSEVANVSEKCGSQRHHPESNSGPLPVHGLADH